MTIRCAQRQLHCIRWLIECLAGGNDGIEDGRMLLRGLPEDALKRGRQGMAGQRAAYEIAQTATGQRRGKQPVS